MKREVVRAFEAWDPGFGMQVILNRGAVLRIQRILFHREIIPGTLPVERAVEFESGGAVYLAGFDRMQDNTSLIEADAA
jgi:hypothetical protein